MTLDQWLDMNDGQNLKRLSELMCVNHGKLQVEGNIGTVLRDEKVNRYGRLGLTLNEAFELTYYKGIVDALTNSSPNPPLTAQQAMARITREAQGRMIELATPEQRKQLLGR